MRARISIFIATLLALSVIPHGWWTLPVACAVYLGLFWPVFSRERR